MLPNLIVPVLNRYDLLQRAISSVDEDVRSLLILDNGQGPEDQLTIPDRFEDVTYLPLPSNLGVAASWNLGVKLFPHDPSWTFLSNDAVFTPGSLAELAAVGSDEVVVSANFPYWQAFAVGEDVIRTVGLWSEDLYPAYFEDDDFTRRVEANNLRIRRIESEIDHDNSSTIRASEHFRDRNAISFDNNRKRFAEKVASGDLDAGAWNLDVRRANDWTKRFEG